MIINSNSNMTNFKGPVWLQVVLSAFKSNPGRQEHEKDPGLFWQSCSQPERFSRHSSISM